MATRAIIFYTDNRLDPGIAAAVQAQLRRAAVGIPIACISLAPLAFGDIRVVVPMDRGVLTMTKQILVGLTMVDADVVYHCEHDVLYAPQHFAELPSRPDVFRYNQAVWKVDVATGRALFYFVNQLSGLCASRELLLEHYRQRVSRMAKEGFSRRNGFEPGTRQLRHGGYDDHDHEVWQATCPNVDLRHTENLTASRWSPVEFRNQKYTAGWTEADAVPGWGRTLGRMPQFLAEVSAGRVPRCPVPAEV